MIPPKLCATKTIGCLVVCQDQDGLNFLCISCYTCKPSLRAQVRHQRTRMVLEILTADAIAICVWAVSPAQDARIWDVDLEEIVGLVDAVRCREGLVAVSVQSMNGNDTEVKSERAYTRIRNSILYDQLLSFRHHLKTLERCLNRLLRFRRLAGRFQNEYDVFAVTLQRNQPP